AYSRELAEPVRDGAGIERRAQRQHEVRGAPVQFLERRVRAPHEDASVPQETARRQVRLCGAGAGLLDEAPYAVTGTGRLTALDVPVASRGTRGLNSDGHEPCQFLRDPRRRRDGVVEAGSYAGIRGE